MQKYNCKTCGAELYWDSNENCLKCEYCESKYQPSDFDTKPTEETAEQENKEYQQPEKADETDKATDNSDETAELVVYKCSNCGAEVITAKSTIATTCAYCGRAISITDKIVGDFRPDSVIPFSIDENKAKEIYKKYCKSTFLTPKRFRDENVVKKMKGIYVPFWLHSFSNDASANVFCENISSHRRGDDKVIVHHQYNVVMDTSCGFQNIPTDSLKNLDNKLMDDLEPFDYGKMTEFSPAYMAGFYAEEYNETPEETRPRAEQRAQDAIKQEIISNAGNYESKTITNYQDMFFDENATYTMLPVWLFHVEYKGKEYTYAVNGESGKITGKLPISVGKVLASIGSSLLISQILALIVRLFS